MTSTYKDKEYNSIKLDLNNKLITLPKLKEVKVRGYRNLGYINGRIINANISKVNNRYYVSVVIEEKITIKETISSNIVGIDLGIKSLVTTSDNEKYDNQKVINKYEKRIKHTQRQLQRKVRGSNNYYKSKEKLNTLYRKLKNTRKYYLHQISKKLTDTNKVIVAETLKIKNMMKNHKISKAISDASLYELIRQLEYKSKWKKVHFYRVDTFYPSSQLCNICGYQNKEVKDLKVREYECKGCNTTHDRDLNAAINIMEEGIRLYIRELVMA
jgi:putative transposase